MNNIKINRNSKLYKFFDKLRDIPGYSSYIKNYEDYTTNRYILNTFNDICTFCRHIFYTIFTTFLYLIILSICFDWLVIQPLKYLFTTEGSLAGSVTLVYSGILFIGYILLLAIQYIYSFLKTSSDKRSNDAHVSEPSLIRQVFSTISQRHNKICKRLEVE